ncbi:isochorismatase family protein [Streptosporangium canum]|uniref:isochorismatase family protein n=1 Tax=Streptosporangium canum TaxID=324952 RepID=UPI00343D37B4
MPVPTIDATTALVLIDLQNFVVGLPTTPYTGPEVVARAVDLADAFRDHGAPVVLVRLTGGADGPDAAPGRTEIPRPPGPLPAGWDGIVDDGLPVRATPPAAICGIPKGECSAKKLEGSLTMQSVSGLLLT